MSEGIEFYQVVAERNRYREALEYLSERPHDEGYREVARSALELAEEGRGARLNRALEILRGLVEPESSPCSFDHHGHCQEHGWFGDEPGECGVREARELLGV